MWGPWPGVTRIRRSLPSQDKLPAAIAKMTMTYAMTGPKRVNVQRIPVTCWCPASFPAMHVLELQPDFHKLTVAAHLPPLYTRILGHEMLVDKPAVFYKCTRSQISFLMNQNAGPLLESPVPTLPAPLQLPNTWLLHWGWPQGAVQATFTDPRGGEWIGHYFGVDQLLCLYWQYSEVANQPTFSPNQPAPLKYGQVSLLAEKVGQQRGSAEVDVLTGWKLEVLATQVLS
mmetsp:Transcript_9485/g.34785  ORF Transcript_9485/g.34785 Transcript_9485/m.34785 type:complete len:229 (-) Transcript_9485:622-1308(-)